MSIDSRVKQLATKAGEEDRKGFQRIEKLETGMAAAQASVDAIEDTDYVAIYEAVLAFIITGSVDADNNYVLGITTNTVSGGTWPYTYTIKLDFPDQSDRQVVISGADLADESPAIADTASKITLAATGGIVCDDATTINDLIVANGSTQNVFNGTLGDFELVANLADLYGDINITLSVTDSLSNTTTTIL